MRGFFAPAGKTWLFAYFILVILLGSLLLSMNGVWRGPERLKYLDALFTSVSAVCVTGLITVDTALYSVLGQTIIAGLIQAGGLGIIIFTTLTISARRGRISFSDRKLVKDYYVESVEYQPKRIVRNVVSMTVFAEILGAALLFVGFRNAGVPSPVFAAVFHAVSAFCNAGFSTFTTNLESFHDHAFVTAPVMLLVVLGGIGFVVVQDLIKRVSQRRHLLSLHTKVVLTGSMVLILVGFVGFLALEGAPAGALNRVDNPGINSLFQAITPRTAGFNTIPQNELSLPSKLLTMALMFVGGGPGSIAGGVKITPVFILLAVVALGADEHGEVRVFRRRIPANLVARAELFLLKAVVLLFSSVFLLSLTESLWAPTPKPLVDIAFESLSAFATVGLSTGITSSLTAMGKAVVIFTMFAGRVGLISLALPGPVEYRARGIDFPKGDILLG